MSDERALIFFRCASPEHAEPRGRESDTLTIHQGKWAYCPHDIRVKGHTWEPTGGVPLAEARRSRKPNAT